MHSFWSSTMWFPFMATENALVDVINHHIFARSPCRPIMNCFHNLRFVSFRWWSFIYFGNGRTTNKVTITWLYNILEPLIWSKHLLATPYKLWKDPYHVRYLKLISNMVWIQLWLVGRCVQVALLPACCITIFLYLRCFRSEIYLRCFIFLQHVF